MMITKMRQEIFSAQRPWRQWLQWVLIAMIVLGVGFRLICLDRKVYWHDEVYTSIRAAGFTRQAIDQELFQNQAIAAPELQKFQQIKPNSTMADTVQSLIMEDPQHPPLYFAMARLWMQLFGSSLTASRLLPALLSLIGLPCMYGLAMELFASHLTALLATAFLAISPFDVLFAQTARQYSLLTVLVIGSSWLLLRAMQQSTWKRWAGYGFSVALGLYTHPFFGLTLIAQAIYVVGMSLTDLIGEFQQNQVRNRSITALLSRFKVKPILNFSLAVCGAFLLYSPWILVLLNQHQRAMATTDWTRFIVGPIYLIKLWILSFTSLFIDLDFGFYHPLTFIVRLPFVLLIFLAFYRIYRYTPNRTRLFIFTSTLVPFLLLAVPDLILGGKRSAVSRYLISCYPGIQLAVAYLLAQKLATGKALWRAILAFCFASAIISCSARTVAETWWDKDLSYSNPEVMRHLNAETSKGSPILLSDLGDDYTNTGDLISLSYGLDPAVRLFLVNATPDLTPIASEPNLFVFRTSKSLKAAIDQQGWQLKAVTKQARLDQVIH